MILTGGVQATQAWIDRKRRARTAARLIAGDLVLAGDELEAFLRVRSWKEAGLASYLTAWKRHAEDFATAVNAMEFYTVDSAFKRLQTLEAIRSSQSDDPELGWIRRAADGRRRRVRPRSRTDRMATRLPPDPRP